MLTWGELGGFRNLTKREKVRMLRETHSQVELSNGNGGWVLAVIIEIVAVIRQLQYRRGFVAHNV